MKYQEFIENNIISIDAGYRGGTLKVDCSSLFPDLEEEAIIGAYQNYLGGGMLGAIVGASMFDPDQLSEKDRKIFEELKEECKKYLHAQTNHVGDEWEETTFESNQARPVSAY